MTSRWYDFPTPVGPRAADGIKARSRQGAIGTTWWSRRFTTVLEDLGMGNRLSRGKNYARRGQVLSLTVEPGRVSAAVQGSRAKPYRVWIAVRAYGKAQWAELTEALGANASYLARLLNQEMPEDIEDVFAAADLPLFPQNNGDLSMDCSCPDWEVPCKHLAAVMYLLAEAFDADPFLILQWRGRGRDELLDGLRALRGGGNASGLPEVRPLQDCLDGYYSRGTGDSPILAPSRPRHIIDRLPALTLEVRGVPLLDLLRPAYDADRGRRPQ